MKLKNLYLAAAVVLGLSAVCLTGCETKCDSCEQTGELRHVSLDLTGSAVQTKAVDVPSLSESNVVKCLLYVFSSQGPLTQVYSSTDGSFDFYLTDNTYDFVAVVNKADLPEGDNAANLTKKDLMSRITVMNDNAVGSFVMCGTLDGHVIQADEKITIEVRRVIAKVTYKVRTQFKGSLAEKDFVVEDIYMTNVVGSNDLAVTLNTPAANDSWFNRMNAEDQSMAGYPADLLFGHIGKKFAQPKDSVATEMSPGHTFYVYPNATAPDNHDKTVWTPRCTRFVVKATLDGKTTYYPVTIGEVARNKHYHIDLTISNYGVDHPEDLPEKMEYVEAMIRIADWEDGGIIRSSY